MKIWLHGMIVAELRDYERCLIEEHWIKNRIIFLKIETS